MICPTCECFVICLVAVSGFPKKKQLYMRAMVRPLESAQNGGTGDARVNPHLAFLTLSLPKMYPTLIPPNLHASSSYTVPEAVGEIYSKGVSNPIFLQLFSDFSLHLIYKVSSDEKGRMTLLPDERDGELLIRANQGHSVKGLVDEEQLLTKIESAAEVPVCVHGTFLRNWPR